MIILVFCDFLYGFPMVKTSLKKNMLRLKGMFSARFFLVGFPGGLGGKSGEGFL